MQDGRNLGQVQFPIAIVHWRISAQAAVHRQLTVPVRSGRWRGLVDSYLLLLLYLSLKIYLCFSVSNSHRFENKKRRRCIALYL